MATNIPKSEIESLAKLLLPQIQNYFESEQGKNEFEEWKKNNTNE
jgi:hypothetical protein